MVGLKSFNINIAELITKYLVIRSVQFWLDRKRFCIICIIFTVDIPGSFVFDYHV